MATVYGVNRTKLNTPIGSNNVGTGVNQAKLGYIEDSYEAASAADTIIQLGGLLPAGSKIVKLDVICDALGTGVTIDVGDGDTVDRYIDGGDVATSAAVVTYPNAVDADNIDANAYFVGTATGDNQLQVKILGATGTGTIYLKATYSL